VAFVNVASAVELLLLAAFRGREAQFFTHPEKMDDAHFSALLHLLQLERCELSLLSFQKQELTEARSGAFFTALAANKSLMTLELSGQVIGPDGARDLSVAIEKHPCLTALGLNANAIQDVGALDLASALARMGPRSPLRSLDLRGNKLAEPAARALADVLKAGVPLQQLLLYNNGICHRGAVALASALEQPGSTLTNLDLQANNIGDVGASALAHAVLHNSALLTLGLRGCQIADLGASALATALGSNSTLTSIDLYANSVGDKGVSELCSHLKMNEKSALSSLELDGNSFRTAGCDSLAGLLRTSTSLTTLALSSRSVGNEGLAALAEALAHDGALTTLVLRGDAPRDEGVVAIGRSLRTNATLTELDLDYTLISEAGAHALADALRASLSLRTLVLCDRGLSAFSVAALADTFKHNRSVTRLDLLEARAGGPATDQLSLAHAVSNSGTPRGKEWSRVSVE